MPAMLSPTADLPETLSQAEMNAVIDAAMQNNRQEQVDMPPVPAPLRQELEPIHATDAPPPEPQAAPPAQTAQPTDDHSSSVVPEPAVEPEKSESVDWLDPELESQAKYFGLTDEDFQQFQNKEDLERTLTVLQRREYNRLRQMQKQAVPTQNPPPEPVVPAAQQPEPKTAPPAAGAAGQFKPALDPNQYDEEVRADLEKNLNSLHSDVTSRLQAVERQLAESERRRQEAEVNNVLMALEGTPEILENTALFGRPDNRTQQQRENYDRLAAACVTMAGMHFKDPAKSTSDPGIRKKALFAEFGQELVNKATKGMIDKFKNGAKKRMNGPSGTPLHPTVDGSGPPLARDAEGNRVVTGTMASLEAEFQRLLREQ